jgi:TonB family protein
MRLDRWVLSILWLLALTAATPARAADEDAEKALAKALARPISPGSVAMLVAHAGSPATVERLAQALAHQDPEVRAVAARVAFATKQAGLVAPLVKAMSLEQNPLAGAEIARAIALIGGRPADDALFEQMARLDWRATLAWAELVGRTRPADLLPRLETLADKVPVGALLALQAANDGSSVAAAFGTLTPDSPRARLYDEMMTVAGRHGDSLPWPVLAVGLQAGGVSRRSVVRDLMRRRLLERAMPPEAAPALADLARRITADEDPWIVVALELGRRAQPDSGAPHPIEAAIVRIRPADLPDRPWRDPLLRTLSREEEWSLRAALGSSLAAREHWESPGRPVADTTANDPSAGSRSRLVRPLTPGVLADVLAIAGCRARADQVLGYYVSYRPSGQPRTISTPIMIGDASEECQQAATLLAALDVAPGDGPVAAERSDLVVIGLRPDDIECRRGSLTLSPRPTRPNGIIVAPRKIRNVTPLYPAELIQRRVQGLVIVEAVISAEGCVTDAMVVRSANPGFNVSALVAVSQWRYEPTLLNGTPVPIVMTVTANYGLQ